MIIKRSLLLLLVTLVFFTGGCKGLLVQPEGSGATDPWGLPPVTLRVNPQTVLHTADSYTQGFNRNHVADKVWYDSFVHSNNGIAKLEKMRELTPVWGREKMIYRIGHGPTDGRKDYAYMTGYHFEEVWGSNTSYPFCDNDYPYDDIRNAIYEANYMGADQFHVINFGTGSPEEAARYVSYLNKAGDANRQSYPYAQQNVSMFELGNEISWSMVRGHDEYASTEILYAERAKLFAEAMRAGSDVPIQVGAVLTANSSFTGNGWSAPARACQNILDTMGEQVDFLTFHAYASPWPIRMDYGSDSNSVVLPTYFGQLEYGRKIIEDQLQPIIDQHNAQYGKDVYLFNSEFFSHIYEAPELTRGLFGVLYFADVTVMAMNHDIRGNIHFSMDHGDLADSLMFFDDDPEQTTAVFEFMKLYAEHWGDEVVQVSGENIPFEMVGKPQSNDRIQLDRLHYTAARKGSTTYVLLVNLFDDKHITASIEFPFEPARVSGYEVSGSKGYDSSSSQVSFASVSNPDLSSYVIKAASISLLEIEEF